MSTPANFNGSRPVIDVNDTAMLLIDHQSGLFQTVGDMPMPELRARAAALAKMASLAGIPVITTASVPQGPNGPLIPEIHENAPHAKYIARKGEINAWDNPEFVAAVKATGRKTLIIAGTITSVCMAFPAIAAVADGYKSVCRYRCLRYLQQNGAGDHPGPRSPGRRSTNGYRRGSL
ncbi:protein YcaC [Klebsiella aerogenes]|nr:protein YcaC [Klebsiella aerogenes]